MTDIENKMNINKLKKNCFAMFTKNTPNEEKEDMHTKFNRTVLSLKVISSIREHQRISTQNGISISKSKILQPLWRWLSSENRTQNIDAVSGVFDQAFHLSNKLVSTRLNNLSAREVLNNRQQLARLEAEIRNGRRGIVNMMSTYESDASTVAKIVFLNESITDRLKQIQTEMKDTEKNSSPS